MAAPADDETLQRVTSDSTSSSASSLEEAPDPAALVDATVTKLQVLTGGEWREGKPSETVFEEIHEFVRDTLQPKWGSDDGLLEVSTSQGEESVSSVLVEPSTLARLRSFVRASLRVAANVDHDLGGTPPEWRYQPSLEFAHSPAAPADARRAAGKHRRGTTRAAAEQKPLLNAEPTHGRLKATQKGEQLETASSILSVSELRSLPSASNFHHAPADADAVSDRADPASDCADPASSHGSSASVPSAPGFYALETIPDSPTSSDLDRGPSLATACVGRCSNVDDQMAALQQRYSKILELMQPHLLDGGGSEGLPPELAPPPMPDIDAPVPGTETLQFAKTCLDQLNCALLTGPFSYSPELEQPADLLRAALRQLVATAAALHHELELRSIAHSRHALQQIAIRRTLRRHWQEAVSTTESDVRRARQRAIDRLSAQVERNMQLLHQLSSSVHNAERASDGQSRTQETYARLLKMAELKRHEALLLRSLLLTASESHQQLTGQVRTMQRSLVQMMRVESTQSLLEEEFVHDTESEIVLLQDVVTQTQQKTELITREVRSRVLRKNKAVQQQRRLVPRCQQLVVQIKRLKALTREAATGTDDRFRTLGTLTRHGQVLHEHTQTESIRVRKVLKALDDQAMKQLEEEGVGVRLDMTPLLQELQTLDAECEASKKRIESGRQQLQKMQRQKQAIAQQRNLLNYQLIKTQTNVASARAELSHLDPDHRTVMTLLQEQLAVAEAMLETVQTTWTDLQNVFHEIHTDLEAVEGRTSQMRRELDRRQRETYGILRQTQKEMEEAERIHDMIDENLADEEDTRRRLAAVVSEIKDENHPGLDRLKDEVERLRVPTADLEELRDQQTSVLEAVAAETAQLDREAAALQQNVDDMYARKGSQQIDIAELREKRQKQLLNLMERRHELQRLRASYDALSHELRQEQWEQEQLVAGLRRWCREVDICNAAYNVELERMERELKTFYGRLESNMREEMAKDERRLVQVNEELRQLMKIYAKKHADCMERDWQLRAALLACSQAAKRSLQPITGAMTGLNTERYQLTQMVDAAVRMRPFKRVNVDVDMPVCPISAGERE